MGVYLSVSPPPEVNPQALANVLIRLTGWAAQSGAQNTRFLSKPHSIWSFWSRPSLNNRLRSYDMRYMKYLVFISLLSAGLVQAQDFPRELLRENDAEDVEVCQDYVCSKIREEVLNEATKCRPLASFKRRRMHVRRKTAANSCKLFHDDNFRMSKGKCSAAIREACEKAGIDGHYLTDNAYNLQKKGMLEKAGFVNMIWKYDEKSAPLGAILTYVGGLGHGYGHIEVRVNPHLYCSDHCVDHPVTGQSAATFRRYKLVGVYLPFASSIQVSATARIHGADQIGASTRQPAKIN